MIHRDLTDEEWAIFEPLVVRTSHGGRPPPNPRRALNGMLWVARTGARWRELPDRYGNPDAVQRQFERWTKSDLWGAVLELLAEDKSDAAALLADVEALRNLHGPLTTCPFCREKIQAGAIKCRYCSSFLVPLPNNDQEKREKTTAGDDSRIVFVVDRGLMNFGKFVIASLAIFITVGATLYGFNVQETADRVRDIEGKIETSKDKINADVDNLEKKIKEAQLLIDNEKKGIQADREEVVRLSKQVASDSERISELLKKSEADEQLHHKLVVGPEASVATTTSPPNGNQSRSVRQVASIYNFPPEFDGSGQTIGLIELGGGYRESDLDTFFAGLKVSRPRVTSVLVGDVKNDPDTDSSSATQVTVDIEIAGGIAFGANIVVYFAPASGKGFSDAVAAAVHDTANHPSIISTSWGSPETSWTRTDYASLEEALSAAAKVGITVLAPAGDHGATDGMTDGRPHVDFPASSPYVLAVGGTRLAVSGNQIASEVAWNDSSGATGGGVSELFPEPTWQKEAKVPLRADGTAGRGIPDVAANADPAGGYLVRFGGADEVVGGTGAATALWAGLIALINQGTGHNVGHLNPLLYTTIGPDGVLRGITEGDNDVNGVKGYSAGPGWNAVAGWGSPDGRKLLAAIKANSAAK